MNHRGWESGVLGGLILGVLLRVDAEALGRPAPGPLPAPNAATRAGRELDQESESLLLAAGRAIPPGLAASRRVEREEERAFALHRLRSALEASPETRAAWVEELRGVLEYQVSGIELWSAAARVVGELGLYELDRSLALGLEPFRPPTMALAARQALYRLYGQWFPAGKPFERPWSPGPDTRALLLELRGERALSIDRLHRLLLFEPGTALAWLTDGDPEVRVRAAEAVRATIASGALESGAIEAEAAVAALFDRLRAEVHPAAFHAELEALLILIEGGTPGSEPIEALRRHLFSQVESGSSALLLTVARGLARLPWETGEAGASTSYASGLSAISAVLERLARAPYSDDDAVVGTLDAFQALCGEVEPSRLEALVEASGVRAPVLALLHEGAHSEGVRSAAAAAVSLVAAPRDAELLIAVLEGSNASPFLRYALLGALAELSAELDPESEEAALVVGAFFDRVDDPEVDLRRRAVALLADPRLATLAAGRPIDPLLAQLAREPVAELRWSLLALVRRGADPRALGALLSLSFFDELATEDPNRLAELAASLEELAHGDARGLMRSGRRLVVVEDEGTHFARLAAALDLVAHIPAEALGELDGADHEAICQWALELRRAGGALREVLESGRTLVQRLVEVHLPGSPEDGLLVEPRRSLARALFLADQLGSQPTATGTLEARQAFEAAVVRSAGTPLEARARRDQARFFLSTGADEEALVGLRSLAAEPAGTDALELYDLRALGRLVRRAHPDERDGAGEAFDVGLLLVRHPRWLSEPLAVRMEELEDLAGTAFASEDPRRLGRAAELFAGLPTEAGVPERSARPGDPVWFGLTARSAELEGLQRLSSRLEAASELPTKPASGSTGEGSAGQ